MTLCQQRVSEASKNILSLPPNHTKITENTHNGATNKKGKSVGWRQWEELSLYLSYRRCLPEFIGRSTHLATPTHWPTVVNLGVIQLTSSLFHIPNGFAVKHGDPLDVVRVGAWNSLTRHFPRAWCHLPLNYFTPYLYAVFGAIDTKPSNLPPLPLSPDPGGELRGPQEGIPVRGTKEYFFFFEKLTTYPTRSVLLTKSRAVGPEVLKDWMYQKSSKYTTSIAWVCYALASVGCSYPGLATEVKVHLWKTIGLPSLLYNLEIFKLKPGQQKFIESVQSSIIKRIVGFPKRSHHTALLQAVNIDDVMSTVTRNTLSLWWRLFQVDNPARKLQIKLMKEFYNGNGLIPGTILQRVVSAGFSPIKSLFTKQLNVNPEVNSPRDGVVDSLRYLICNENFIKPYSEEHVLATLLTRAF